MKKALLAVLSICSMAVSLFAQTESVFYYYQGKKIFVPVTYRRFVAGLKKEAFLSRQNIVGTLADNLMINRDSVKKATTENQFVINNVADAIAGKAIFVNILKKDFIAYAHPCLVGAAGKLAGYGDEFVVRLKQTGSSKQLREFAAKFHCDILKVSVGDNRTCLLSAGGLNHYDALKMANTFFETGLFEYAQPDFTNYDGLNDAPNDPLYNLQWAHKNNGTAEQHNGVPGADLQVDSAWLITMGNSNIKIAVIDTGIDTAQADLKANLVQGYDCITQTDNIGDGMPRNMQNAHGTACAGIIAAVANNNTGIAGIAPNCKLMPVNITNESNIFASEFAIASGIDYAWQHSADVLTNSWDLSLPSSIIDAAIHRAVTLGRNGKGALVFFATGNENSGIAYPSCNPEVIAVGGTNMCNQRKSPTSCDGEYWWGANYGAGLDVVAPCIDIVSSDISGSNGYNTAEGTDGDYYNLFGGTSAACPHAAAIAALVLSVDTGFTATQVRTIIETSCTRAGDYQYTLTQQNLDGAWNNEMGYGRVNAYKSVLAARSKRFCNVGIQPPASTVLCKGSSLQLELADKVAGVYTWLQDGMNIGTGNSITVTTAGVYDVLATYASGCSATSAPVSIKSPDSILRADAGKQFSICQGSAGIVIGGEPSASGGKAFTNSKRAFGYDILLGNIIRFNTENPREYEVLPLIPATTVADNDFAAGDFTAYGYYVLTRAGNLFRIDTATGQEFFIGLLVPEAADNAGKEWCGLAWDPSVKKLYALTNKGTVNKLYEVNPFNGTAIAGTRISNINWIAFNSSGELYGFYTNLRLLSKINKLTGELTFVSDAIGAAATQYLDGAIDPLDGKVYMTTNVFFNGKLTQDLYVVDTGLHKAFVQGHIGALNTVTALAVSSGTYQYIWSPSEGLSAPNVANPVANPVSATTYTLTVTDACGQKAFASVKVNPGSALPKFGITATRDSICVGEITRLSVTADSTFQYQWFLNGNGITGAADSFYIATRMGDFRVRVNTPHNGCIDTSDIFTVKDCSVWLNNNVADTTCYAYFYPSHGYRENSFRPQEAYTKTIYPQHKGDLLELKFNSFLMKNLKDTLTVYNGADTTAPILAQLTVNVPPVNMTYYSTTGPMTFRIKTSDEPTSTGSWEGFLECFTPRVYRTRVSGLFESADTWEVKTGDNSYTFAATPPQYLDDSIVIQEGHTVTLSANINANVDQLWLQKGANLIINGHLNIFNGTGTDLLAEGNISMGTFGTINGNTGAVMVAKGNLSGGTNYIFMPCYLDGAATQSIGFDNIFFQSLHILNNNGVISSGFLRADSLVMNTSGKLVVDSAEISFLLELDNGIIDVNNNGVIKSSAALQLVTGGGNAKSFVNGPLSLPVKFKGDYLLNYPIGKSNLYKPVVLTISQHLFPYENQYRAELINSAPFAFSLPGEIQNVSPVRYYKISVLNQYPVSNAAITLPYDLDDGVTDPAHLRIVRDSANRWIDAGGVATGEAPGTITSTNSFTNFTGALSSGYFALANATGGINTLAIGWLSFTARLQDKDVALQWTVSNETGSLSYIVERSEDGSRFTTLASIPAGDGTVAIRKYEWTDKSPSQGLHYYRIKAIARDASFRYSKIISVMPSAINSFLVDPNPARDIVTIKSPAMIREIDCYNEAGQLIKKVFPMSARYRLSVSGFAAGIYTLHCVTGGESFDAKILKQ